jgi:hypothetical protein
MSRSQTSQSTLLTAHKGVDLHAATALLVMKDRLVGGDRLEGLFRCEMHTFWNGTGGPTIGRLLDIGRYFNPNKHHYGHFEWAGCGPSWLDSPIEGNELDPDWPGRPAGTDLILPDGESNDLYRRLLGSAVPEGVSAVDVVSFSRGQEGPVLSGVLWRLWIRGDVQDSLAVGCKLAVASSRKEGLLVNPHMESWLATVR